MTLRKQSRKNDPAAREAETWYLSAIEEAHKQGACSLELRASTSLARLWLRQGGRVEEARRALRDSFNEFSEGFETKDLADAKALLDQLG